MKEFIINWNDKYNTGHKDIDKQHKKLFDLLSIFASAYLMNEQKTIVSDFLFELEEYTHYHFNEEENLIRKKGDIIDEEHLEQHALFKETLHNLKFDFVSENKEISTELFSFLQNWLQDHILGTDKIALEKL